tara:strand:- start:328 stop:933 length:606 start_codon:yes stop_codon:yes gene_type:complete
MTLISSPILDQAGFIKHKAAVVVEQWVAQLDGAMQYWKLTKPVTVSASGGWLELDVAAGTVDWSTIISGYTDSLSRAVELRKNGVSGNCELIGMPSGVYFYFDNILIENGVTPWPNENVKLKIVNNSSEIIYYRELCIRRSDTPTAPIEGYVKNLAIYDENDNLINEIPLNNKAQGATQLATVGSVNASMPNYTDAVWRKP